LRDISIIIRYRKAVSYGHHVLLGALETLSADVSYEVRFATSAAAVVEEIKKALPTAHRVLVLWSFYSPDALEMAAELQRIRAEIDDPAVTHIAGGVHATAEPVQVLDAGWDIAAVGEGETTFLRLVAAGGEPAGIPGLVYRDEAGGLVRTGRAERRELDAYPAFSVRWRRFNPIEITRGCVYACRFCQTPFMFSAKFRHRSVENVKRHVEQMVAHGRRDVRFITPTSLSYGSGDENVNLEAVEELLAACKSVVGKQGRVFFGSFPSEVRPEHVSVRALRLIKRYCANDNLIIGAQSGSARVLEAAKRGHGVQEVRDAVRIGVQEGFRINVDMIFGMPEETPDDAAASLALARELADLGARIHAHTFMPLPGTPWREATPGRVDPETLRAIGELTGRGALYGHWERQQRLAGQLADAARAYPRPGKSRTLLPLASDPEPGPSHGSGGTAPKR